MSLDILPSPRDVIAMRLRDRLDVPALQHLVDIVERSISANDRTHVFIEIGIHDFDIRQIVDFVRRAAPWLRTLQRFGRIAIVSDQLLVLAAAGLDRMLSPDIDCEAFQSRDRERALAWVEGRYRMRGGKSCVRGRSDIARQRIDFRRVAAV